MPIVPTVVCFFVGARLIWKKVEDMDPNLVQRLSVESHSLVMTFTFAWPLTLGALYTSTTNQCEWGYVVYFILFGVPAVWSLTIQFKHTKVTRNTLGYLLIFLPGLAGWFMLPLVAINCKVYTLQEWTIFGCFPLFCLLSGSRFVKFYDVRHPEGGDAKPKDYGFISEGDGLMGDVEKVRPK